jgi:hypothetical protein
VLFHYLLKRYREEEPLISKLKEETISREEAQELIYIYLEKEKRIILDEGDCMLVFAILSLISYVNEYSDSC